MRLQVEKIGRNEDSLKTIKLMEAAGIEPASADPLPLDLHV